MKEGGPEESSAFEEKKEDQPQRAVAHREELPQEEAKQVFGKYSELKTRTQKEIEELEKQREQAKGAKFTYGEKEYNPENIEEYLKAKQEAKAGKEEIAKKKQETKEQKQLFLQQAQRFKELPKQIEQKKQYIKQLEEKEKQEEEQKAQHEQMYKEGAEREQAYLSKQSEEAKQP